MKYSMPVRGGLTHFVDDVAVIPAPLSPTWLVLDFDAVSTALNAVGIERTASACEGCAAHAAAACPHAVARTCDLLLLTLFACVVRAAAAANGNA